VAIYDLEEQEKIDALRRWWEENRKFVLTTIVACLVAVAAVNGWRWYQRTQAAEAAEIFKTMSGVSGKENLSKIQETSARLRNDYGSTAYAPRAALVAAEASFKARDLPRARSELQWVMDNADEAGLRDLARLRLAGVALDEKKPDEALALLNAQHDSAFDGLYLELKGDVLVAQGKRDEAREAYTEALKETDAGYRAIIEAKRDAVGEAN
jgi:predicted negative regulator of RcsB-dependent stress response